GNSSSATGISISRDKEAGSVVCCENVVAQNKRYADEGPANTIQPPRTPKDFQSMCRMPHERSP
ncbi:MAG: hypothetical protein ABI451_10035, partial [Dokdonella sp.]